MLRHAELDCTRTPPGAVAAVVGETLADPGAILLRGLGGPDPHAALTALGRSIGTPSAGDISAPDGDWIHRVEARRRPLRDSTGNPVLSTSRDHFRCHTDEFFIADPADVVLQLCVSPARDGGGRSQLAFVCDVVAQLDDDVRRVLRAPAFPTRFGQTALLTSHGDADWRLRFNADELAPRSLTFEQRRAVSALEAAVEVCEYDFALGAGDCLAIDNHTVLHGRTAFGRRAGRLLLRMRVRRERVPAQPAGTA